MLADYETAKHSEKEERKRRISSARKIYGNIERDKIKKTNSIKESAQKKTLNDLAKIELDRKLKEKKRVEAEKYLVADLKDFNLMEIEKSEIGVKSKPKAKNKLNKKGESKANLNLDSDKLVVVKEKTQTNAKNNIDRYIQYLKQVLKKKLAQYKVELPPLCQCNLDQTSLWDNDWNTCANNCVFYNNPKGILFFVYFYFY